MAATSGSFPTLRLSTLRRPSRFELILSFGGDTLANLFSPDIPKPFAAFLGPVPTVFGATITSFELVATIVLFLLELAGSRMLLGEKVMSRGVLC